MLHWNLCLLTLLSVSFVGLHLLFVFSLIISHFFVFSCIYNFFIPKFFLIKKKKTTKNLFGLIFWHSGVSHSCVGHVGWRADYFALIRNFVLLILLGSFNNTLATSILSQSVVFPNFSCEHKGHFSPQFCPFKVPSPTLQNPNFWR